MARKIAVVCVCLALVSPAGVSALGLGDIHVRSALNQPLDAEVELISATAGDLEDLEVSLAPRETFERYGLDRPAILAGLDFDVSRGEDGEPVLRVTSDRPVGEPFLTFLVEAHWPRGRLLREYTVLLDPPVYLADDALPAPAREETVSRSAPASTASGPVSRRAQREEPMRASGSGNAAVRDGEYGPVARNETLWTIADRLRAEPGVSINQMMIALYRANPEAFGENINLLRAGAVLRVPDVRVFDELAAREADSEVQRQYTAWQAGSDSRSARASEADPATGRLRLVAPTDEAGGEDEATRPASAAASGSDPAGDTQALQQQLDELQTRLADAERLLELKDNELAALQGRLAERTALEPGDTAPAAETSPRVDPAAAPAEEAVAPPAASEVAVPVATGPRPATVRDSDDFGDSLTGILGSTWLYVGLGMALLLAAMLMFARRRRAPESGRWQSFDADEDAAAAPAARISTTQTLRALPDADESIVVVEQKSASPARRPTAAPAVKPRESRFEAPAPDDDTLSSATAIHLDHADPLAEADFHMAYGLYDQAADLVRKASREEPGRRDLRMKLLEIYFVWGNEQAFLEEARQLRDALPDESNGDWDKVLIMGKQICPDEPLFAGDPGTAGGEAGAVDLDLADSAGGESTVDFVTADEGPGDTALDLDFGDTFDDGRRAKDTLQPRSGGDTDILDFKFVDDEADEVDELRGRRDEGSTIEASGFESPTLETPTLEQPGPESPTVESPTLESARYADTTVETPTIEQRVEALRAGGASDQTAEIDLDDLGLDLENLRDDTLEGSIGDEEETMLADVSGFDAPRRHGEDSFDATLTTPAGRPGGRDWDATAEVPHFDRGSVPSRDSDATSEFAALDADALDIDLEDLSAALESSDTAAQPGPVTGDTVRQPRRASGDTPYTEGAAEDEYLDVDLTEVLGDDADPFGAAGVSGASDFSLDELDESEVDSEIGTKLDLARAYMDMGDPEGANSILQEVLEEGDASQREEAQRLLSALP